MTTYPLLQSQFGIFMEWMKEPTSVQYNLPVKFSFGKEIEADRTPEDATISELNIISEEEKQELISLGKGEVLDIDFNKTFVNLFTEQAKHTPDRLAVVDNTSHYTYGELERRANILSCRLVELGVKQDDFVSVMMDRTIDYPLSVISVHKAGAAFIPLDIEYPVERLLYMIQHSESKVLITTHDVLNEKRKKGIFFSEQILFLDEFNFAVEDKQTDLSRPEGLAYMIYTSGSTGTPKGVVLHQAGVRNFMESIIKIEKLNSDDRIGSHRSFSFDSHIEDLFPVLSVGGSMHIMPSAIRKDLSLVHKFIIDHQITGVGFTTSFGMMMINEYDLPVRFVSLAGEKMQNVRECNATIINAYGPTECTDITHVYELEHNRIYDNIPIGHVLPNSYGFIVSPNGHLVPRGVPGELCFAGIQVARGYWKLPEQTSKVFMDCPFVSNDEYGHRLRMYHTGDLCRYNSRGEVEYLGRLDSQIKIRGYRIELGEIENTVKKIPQVKSAVAVVRTINENPCICLYYIGKEEESPTEYQVEKYIQSSTLPEYMLPSAYIQLDEFPLTPNGKVNREALPVPELRAEEIVAPETEEEKALFRIISEQLETRNFGITTNLISIGLTSMEAIKLSVNVRKKVGMELSTNNILQHPYIRTLSTLLCYDKKKMKKYPKQTYYPSTDVQRGIFQGWKEHPDSLLYDIPYVLDVTGIDVIRLRNCLEKVVNMHPYLKTHFVLKDGDIIQIRRDDSSLPIKIINLNTDLDSTIFQDHMLPFNILGGDLCRIEIICGNNETYLFMNISHIIADGSSLNIFMKDLQKAYKGDEIQPEGFTAYDYSLYLQEWKSSEEDLKSKAYFDKLLKTSDFTLYPLSDDVSQKIGLGELMIDIEKTNIESFCKNTAITEHAFFITCISQVLHYIMNEKDVVIGFDTNCRNSFFGNTVGMFLQTLPALSHDTNDSITEKVQAMSRQIFSTMKHDNYSSFSCMNIPNINIVYEGGVLDYNFTLTENRTSKKIKIELDTPMCPMQFYITPIDHVYYVILDYATNLYSEKDISIFLQTIKTFAEKMVTLDQNDSILKLRL